MFREFSNQFGSVVLEIHPEVYPISSITGDVLPHGWSLTLEQLEQITLIAENDHLQPIYRMSDGLCYLIHHPSRNTGQYARIHTLAYVHPESARDYLANPANWTRV